MPPTLRTRTGDAQASPGRPNALRRLGGFVIDKPWVFLCLFGFVALSYLAYGTRSQEHHVKAEFASGMSVYNGLDVQIAGVDVGKISGIEYEDGRAIVELGIEDEHWPLNRGTTAALRFGTTLGNGTRRVDLEPGPKNAPEIPEDGIITTKDTTTPIEFDEVFNTFDKKTRVAVKDLFGNGASALEGRSGQLRSGLDAAVPAFEETGNVLEDLARDGEGLRRLVLTGNATTRTLARKRPVISDLVSVSAATFDTFARNSNGIRESLDEFPSTLRQTRTTLQRTDESIEGLDELVADARPGIAALGPLLTAATPASADLERLAPAASDAVTQLGRSAPKVTKLLKAGVPFAKRADPVFAKAGEQLQCVRPYIPEIAGWASNWNSWAKNYDNKAHYGRIQGVGGATFFTSYPPTNTNDFLSTLGKGLSYAMPRPPGLNQRQPWFIEECGYGRDSIDPSKDPEDPR